MREKKIVSLEDAGKMIQDGCHLSLCGFAVSRCAIAFVHELIRQGKKNLTVSQCVAGMDTDLLVGAGCVKKLIYSGGSLDRFGPVSAVNRAIEEGKIEVEEYSGLAMSFKTLAGALGISFIPIKSLIGSNMLEEAEKRQTDKVISCPFTGEKYVALSALTPDIAVLHANMVDEEGNVIIFGPTWNLREMAFAAKKVIVTTEKIVPRSVTEKYAELTILPSFKVDAIVHVPFGAYPTCVFREYDYDDEHLKLYAEVSRKGGHEYENYLQRYIYDCHDYWDYLSKFLDVKKVANLLADLETGY